MNDMNYQILLDLQRRVDNGEALSDIENKILLELSKYYYGD